MPKTTTAGVKLAQQATMDWDTQSVHLKPGAQKSMRDQVNAAFKRICGGSFTRKKKNLNWLFNDNKKK